MKAMVFAAGLGTRLRPITDHKPKALVEVGDVPLLEIVLTKLKQVGVTDVIINLHHFPDQIKTFLNEYNNFGLHIVFSFEHELLDTGGGLKQAGWFFEGSEPFIVHNVDIISDIDLLAMLATHQSQNSLATLAVMPRQTSRYFIFDEENRLCGWKSLQSGEVKMTRKPKGQTVDLAFGGIHVLSPEIFGKLLEHGAFSIVDAYLRLAGDGERIYAFRTDAYSWRDVGKIAELD